MSARVRALALVFVVGCGASFHPAVMPDYSKVPEDKLDSSIQSSLARPDAEHQPTTKQGRRDETMAAFAAAYLGILFSKSENATIGAEWIDVSPAHASHAPVDGDGSGSTTPMQPPAAFGSGDDLVPWIRLEKP